MSDGPIYKAYLRYARDYDLANKNESEALHYRIAFYAGATAAVVAINDGSGSMDICNEIHNRLELDNDLIEQLGRKHQKRRDK